MTFFLLEIDSAEATEIPQTKPFTGYNFNHPDAVSNIRERYPIQHIQVPEKLELRPRAKWTDLLIVGEIGSPFIVVSQRFLEMLKRVQTSADLVSFPVKVAKKDDVRPYYLLGENPGHPEFIDFKRAPVVMEDFEKKNREEIWVNNADEFAALRAKSKGLLIYVIIHPKINPEIIDLDIFWLGWGIFFSHYIVSDQFVEKAKQAGLTGLSFIPLADRGYN